VGQEKRGSDETKAGKLRVEFDGDLLFVEKMGSTLFTGAELRRKEEKVLKVCLGC
jgi:hypothetical protein